MTDSRQPAPATGSQAWVLRSRDLLQRSADDLDGHARARLNRARQAALAGLDPRPVARSGLRWLGGAAITAGIALVVWQALLPPLLAPPESAVPTAARIASPAPVLAPPARIELTPISAPDFELLADGQQFALVEDLEFYAWLESTEASGG
jgi:hypothetical protein